VRPRWWSSGGISTRTNSPPPFDPSSPELFHQRKKTSLEVMTRHDTHARRCARWRGIGLRGVIRGPPSPKTFWRIFGMVHHCLKFAVITPHLQRIDANHILKSSIIVLAS
jgi:hypothetical protein